MVSSYQTGKVLENQHLGGNIYRLRVEHQASPAIRSGQFYMLRGSAATFVARPISVYDADAQSVSFLYAVVGAGTQALADLEVGNKLSLMGRLGNGFCLPQGAAQRRSRLFSRPAKQLRCKLLRLSITYYCFSWSDMV